MPYTVIIEGQEPTAPCGCDWCGWRGVFSALVDIDECVLTPGDPSPAGRCPDCHALAYVIKE